MSQERHRVEPTSLIQQYYQLKEGHEDCLLFFRVGDFYELFFEDAILAAKALDIALTKRAKGQPMCGVPAHTGEAYLERLVHKGYKVAICDQMQPTAQGICKRDVVRVVTPGTATENNLLDEKRNNFLLSLCLALDEKTAGLAFADISTGDFWTECVEQKAIQAALMRICPREILLTQNILQHNAFAFLKEQWGAALRVVPDLEENQGVHRLNTLYQRANLNTWSDFSSQEIHAAGVLAEYICATQKKNVPYLRQPQPLRPNHFLELDPFTRRNLELTQTLKGERVGSVLYVLDQTVTAGGSRLLFFRLCSPLRLVNPIQKRLEQVRFFVQNPTSIKPIRQILKQCPDLERALSRLSAGRGTLRDLAALKNGLNALPALRNLLEDLQAPAVFLEKLTHLSIHEDLTLKLNRALKDSLPHSFKAGGLIADSYCQALDDLREIQRQGQLWIQTFQEQCVNETGITTLTVQQHKALGYIIEVEKKDVPKVPFYFNHRQTLAHTARYTTPALLEWEKKLQDVTDQAIALEEKLFQDLVQEALVYSQEIATIARLIAALDVTVALAKVALEYHWVEPVVDESNTLNVRSGCHVVVACMQSSKRFTPNDCLLDQNVFFWLITGPNMAGKSTFLRQNALILLLAQMGSFVPVAFAHMGVADRIFSRVGAMDDLSRGQSTFMVEMIETATLLNQATEKSLIIIDEVGRGTSTYDGIALAWACAEKICQDIGCRTLFSTHYSELTVLEKSLPHLGCYAFDAQETDGGIGFSHSIERGACSRSYGIHVARLAGFPNDVLARAEVILKNFKSERELRERHLSNLKKTFQIGEC